MTKQIASIYYMPVEAKRTLYQGHFKMPAVKRGEKPFLLSVPDHYQWETQPFFKGTWNGRQRQERLTVLGEHIANCILSEWTDSHPEMNPQCGPGIWLVRDVIYLTDDKGNAVMSADGKQAYRAATDQEREQMFAEDHAAALQRQATWGEASIRKGDIMAEEPKKVPFIPDYCKEACRYYGRERKWLYELRDGDVKACPFCTKSIAANAVKCPFCSEVVDFEAYAALQAKRKAAEEAALKGVVRPPVQKQPQPVA